MLHCPVDCCINVTCYRIVRNTIEKAFPEIFNAQSRFDVILEVLHKLLYHLLSEVLRTNLDLDDLDRRFFLLLCLIPQGCDFSHDLSLVLL